MKDIPVHTSRTSVLQEITLNIMYLILWVAIRPLTYYLRILLSQRGGTIACHACSQLDCQTN